MTRHHVRRLTNPAMTTLDGVVAMADGNPGATNILVGLVGANILAMLMLDDLGIYGDDIWIAYKEVCGSDMDKLVAASLDGSILPALRKVGYVS